MSRRGCNCCECPGESMTSSANSLFDQDGTNNKLYVLRKTLPKNLVRMHFENICTTNYFWAYGWPTGDLDNQITIRLKGSTSGTEFFSARLYRQLGEFVEVGADGRDIHKWYLLAEVNEDDVIRVSEVLGETERKEGMLFSEAVAEVTLPNVFDVLALESHVEIYGKRDQGTLDYQFERVPYGGSTGDGGITLEIEYSYGFNQPNRFAWHGLPEESKGKGLNCPPVHTCSILSPYTHVLWDVDSISVPRANLSGMSATETKVTYNDCNAAKSFSGRTDETLSATFEADIEVFDVGLPSKRYESDYTMPYPPEDDAVDDGLEVDVVVYVEVIDSTDEDYPEDADPGDPDMVRVTVELTLDGPFSLQSEWPNSSQRATADNAFEESAPKNYYPPDHGSLDNTEPIVRDMEFTFDSSSRGVYGFSPTIVLEKIVDMFPSTNPPTLTFTTSDVVTGVDPDLKLCDGYYFYDEEFTDHTFIVSDGESHRLNYPTLYLIYTYAAYSLTGLSITLKKNVDYP